MNFVFLGDLLAAVFDWIRMCMHVKIVHVHTYARLVFLCFVDLASLYNLANKANLVHNFS